MDFKENWEKRSITDIKIVNGEKRSFEIGYEPLIEREWPGTVPGCDCTNAFRLTFGNNLRSGGCD